MGIAGLISTASAINSTLFSEAIFAKNLIADEILPEQMGDPDEDAAPARTVLVIGFFTAAFTVLGSSKPSWSSRRSPLSSGSMSALALTHRDEADINVIPPLVGTIGSAGFFVMLTWYLYAQLPSVFWLVVIIAALVFTVEAVYFERDSIEEGSRR